MVGTSKAPAVFSVGKAQGGGAAMDDCAVNKSVILVSKHPDALLLTSRWVAAVMMKCREEH